MTRLSHLVTILSQIYRAIRKNEGCLGDRIDSLNDLFF